MQETKVCKTCGETKSVSDFPKRVDNRVNPPRVRWEAHCMPCTYANNKAWRVKTGYADRYNEAKKADRRDRKKRAVEYKGGVCEHCGGKFHHAAFDFHHINADEKELDPGLLMQAKDDVLFTELDKCMLLCANCHRIHHYEEGTLGEIKARKGKSKNSNMQRG